MLTTIFCYVALVSRSTHKPLNLPIQRIKLVFTEADLEFFEKEVHYPKNVRKAACEHLDLAIEISTSTS